MFRIERADAIKFLRAQPDASIDLICTDPAYNGMNKHLSLGKGRIVGEYKQRETSGDWFAEFDDSETNYRLFLHECERVLKPNRHIFLMFDSYSLITLGSLVRDYFDVKNLIVWDKVAIGMGHYFRRRTEMILFASKGKRPVSSRDMPDIWPIQRVHRPAYPTQKPVELFEAMISASIGSDDPSEFVVCDPFIGSGSSGIASLRQGCRFIGADISDQAVDVARLRLERFNLDRIDELQGKPATNQVRRAWWEATRLADGDDHQ